MSGDLLVEIGDVLFDFAVVSPSAFEVRDMAARGCTLSWLGDSRRALVDIAVRHVHVTTPL